MITLTQARIKHVAFSSQLKRWNSLWSLHSNTEQKPGETVKPLPTVHVRNRKPWHCGRDGLCMIAIGITYFGGPGARSCYLYSVIHVVQMVASSVTKPEDLKGRLDKFKLHCETGRRWRKTPDLWHGCTWSWSPAMARLPCCNAGAVQNKQGIPRDTKGYQGSVMGLLSYHGSLLCFKSR